MDDCKNVQFITKGPFGYWWLSLFSCQAQPPSIWTILKIPDSTSTLLSLFLSFSLSRLEPSLKKVDEQVDDLSCGPWASWLAVKIQFHGFPRSVIPRILETIWAISGLTSTTSTLKQCGSWQLEPPQGSVWKRRALNRCWVPPQVAPGVYCFLCEGSRRSKLE